MPVPFRTPQHKALIKNTPCRPTHATIVATSQQKQKIDSLNSVIIKLEDKQIELNRSIFDQQLEINILNHSIDSTNKEIVKVRKYYAKKIKDITTYTPTQLDNFFTERYQ